MHPCTEPWSLESTSSASTIDQWIRSLPEEVTAYPNPFVPVLGRSAQQVLQQRKVLRNLAPQASFLNAKRPKMAEPFSLKSGQPSTPNRPSRKRTRTGSIDENETPKAAAEVPIRPFIDPPHFPAPVAAGDSSPQRSSRSSYARSTSPVKRMGDIKLGDTRVDYVTENNKTFPLPVEANDLLSKIKPVMLGKSVIPISLEVGSLSLKLFCQHY
jgi:hypothetical protein